MPRDAQAAPPTQPEAVSSQRVNRVRMLLGLPPLRQSEQPDTARQLEPVAIPAQIEPAVPMVQPGWPNAGQAAEEAWIAEELAAAIAEREPVIPSKSPANDQPGQPQRAHAPNPLPSPPASSAQRAGEEGEHTEERTVSALWVAEQASASSERQPVTQADGAPEISEPQRAASALGAAQPSAVALTTIDIPGQVSQSTAAKQPDVQSSAPRPVSKPMPAAAQREHPVSVPVDTTGDTPPAQVPVSGQPRRSQPVDVPVDMPVEGPGQASFRPLQPPVAVSRMEMRLPSIGGQAIAEPIALTAALTPPRLGSVVRTDVDEHDKRLPTEEQAPQPTTQPPPKPPSSTAAVAPTVQPAARAQEPFGQLAGVQRVPVQSTVAPEHAFPALEPSAPEQHAWNNRPAERPNSGQASHMVQALRKQIDALTAKVAGLEQARQSAPPTVIIRNRRVPHTAETRAFWARSYRGRAHLRI